MPIVMTTEEDERADALLDQHLKDQRARAEQEAKDGLFDHTRYVYLNPRYRLPRGEMTRQLCDVRCAYIETKPDYDNEWLWLAKTRRALANMPKATMRKDVLTDDGFPLGN
ncbi:hypothetical protein LJR231_000308 [Phyllobacterium sp. LjRoot231]|uniref:hypothetical protein n=1 Tax=Phyllobacterium sp. LjRoot231 TaxID=3342289 RepID=UPI003ED0806D